MTRSKHSLAILIHSSVGCKQAGDGEGVVTEILLLDSDELVLVSSASRFPRPVSYRPKLLHIFVHQGFLNLGQAIGICKSRGVQTVRLECLLRSLLQDRKVIPKTIHVKVAQILLIC